MIKIAAMLLIAFGFAFSGFSIASFYKKKTEILNDIVAMLSVAQTQLRYACMPVGSLMRILAENRRISNLGFISSCVKKTEIGKAFPPSWRESIEEEKELCRLIPDVLSYLFQFGEELGSTDLEGQLSCCEYYKQIFQKELEMRDEQNKKYSKLFPTLGVMLGISAAVIIV
ncbi:MAG: stage III sporulation protein AB [Clostridia bacterium]|nr:stage III sporulation protein AB [Clostridia bacterium]